MACRKGEQAVLQSQQNTGQWSFHPNLSVGPGNDMYEQEADAVAEQVMRMSESNTIRMQPVEEEEELLQPKLRMQPIEEEEEMMQPKLRLQLEEEEEMLQAKGNSSDRVASGESTKQINAAKGNGKSLPPDTNQFMSNAFATDFSRVQVHTGSQAAQLNGQLGAKAFTHKNNIYFNKGQYNPSSLDGKHLLAHELTHVQQQNPRSASSISQKSIMRRVRGMVAPTREGRVVNDEEWELVTSALQNAKNMVSATVDSLNGVHRLLFSRADPRAFTERQQLVAGLFRIHYKNPRPLDAFEAHENYGFILTALQSLGRNSFRVVSTQQAIDDPGRDTYAYVRGRDPTIYLSEIFFNDLQEIEPGEGSVTVGPPLLSPEQKARLLIHETAHFRLGVTHRGGVFGLDLVNCERGFSIRTANQGLQNAYVYDHFAYCISQLGDSD